MQATIKHVAQAAGVSPSTVSRVLTGDVRISEPTRQRVQQAMNQLGYHPNAIARSLVRQSSRTIGLVMSRPARTAMAIPFYPEIIGGIAEMATSAGYHVLLVSSDSREQEYSLALDLLRHRKVEGIVHLASRVQDKLISALVGEHFPAVVIGRVPGMNIPCVNNDNVAAARMAVEHLLGRGLARVAFVGGSPDLVVTCDRLEGYRQALKGYGITPQDEWVVFTESSVAAAMIAAGQLFEGTVAPTGIFAMDDTIAAGILKAAHRRGLHVPRDLAVVGFNDDPIADFVEPALTTVRIPIFEMGRQAAGMLLQIIQAGNAPDNIVVPAELIVRHSS